MHTAKTRTLNMPKTTGTQVIFECFQVVARDDLSRGPLSQNGAAVAALLFKPSANLGAIITFRPYGKPSGGIGDTPSPLLPGLRARCVFRADNDAASRAAILAVASRFARVFAA